MIISRTVFAACSICHRRPRAPGSLDCAECASRAAQDEADSPERTPGATAVTWPASAGTEPGRNLGTYGIPERGIASSSCTSSGTLAPSTTATPSTKGA